MAKSAGRKPSKSPAHPSPGPRASRGGAAKVGGGSPRAGSSRPKPRVPSAAPTAARRTVGAAKKTQGGASRKPTGGAAPKAPRAQPASRSGPGVADHPARAALSSAADDLLALQLLEELEIGPGIDIASVDLRLRDGRAVLRGTVSDPSERESARELLLESGSVTEVINLLQIDPDRREEDRDLARQAQECLELDPEFSEESISVACTGRAVVLRGTVAHARRKVVAGLLVLRQVPARALVNRLVFEIRG